jgi:Zn finger protein HypA/HybF involved in hydrogenase expression
MPRSKKDIVKISGVGNAVWLKCRNCQHVWYPDARKWRGQNPISHEKILRCPKCNVKNVVPKAVIEYFVEHIKTDTEYGFGKPTK